MPRGQDPCIIGDLVDVGGDDLPRMLAEAPDLDLADSVFARAVARVLWSDDAEITAFGSSLA